MKRIFGCILVAVAVWVGPSPGQAQNLPQELANAQAAANTAEPEVNLGPQGEPNAPVEPVAVDPFAAPHTIDDAVRQNTAAALRRAQTFLRLGALEDAARLFWQLVGLDDTSIDAWEGLRRSFIAAHRPEHLPKVLVRLVELYRDVQDRSRANRRLDELLTLQPNHPSAAMLEQSLGRRIAEASDGTTQLFDRFRSFLGVLLFLGLALLLSNNRRRIPLRLVAWGLGLQLFFAVIILRTTPGEKLFAGARIAVEKILSFTDAGASFLFGSLYNGVEEAGATVRIVDGNTGDYVGLGMIFVVHVLPTIIFFGALMSVLYHLGLIQRVVQALAWVMQRTMRTSGAESLSAAGNVFVGQTEAPLVIKPYISKMTQSELMAVMTGGFATVAGGVLAAFVQFGIDAGHLLAASVMSAPAALVVAKIIYPETEVSETGSGKLKKTDRQTANVIDAAAGGAIDGLRLAVNVAAMLIAFIALIAMLNWVLGLAGGLSLRTIFGYAFYPLSWFMGVHTDDLLDFGMLLGTKLSINEFVAFVDLGSMKQTLHPRSFIIGTYALCGFANFSSIAIQLGGISGIAPHRRADLARIGLKAMFGGAMASWLTACIAGILL